MRLKKVVLESHKTVRRGITPLRRRHREAEENTEMKQLNETQQAERDTHVEELEAAKAAVEEALNAYQAKLEAAREWAEGIAEQAEAWAEDRSEKWQQSDACAEHDEWRAQFSDFAAGDDMDINELGLDHAEELAELAVKVGA